MDAAPGPGGSLVGGGAVDAAWAEGDIPAAWRAEVPPGTDPSVLLIGLWLNRLGRLFEVRLDALVRRHGLVPSEFRVLGTLLLDGPPYELSPTQLNAIVVLTSGGMTKAVSRLETLALVERRADPSDGRGVLVRLTPSGVRTGRALLAELVGGLEEQLTTVSAGDRSTIVDSLRTLLGTYGEAAPDAGGADPEK
jgi:DNA-binding MarR family transcriptional regulator